MRWLRLGRVVVHELYVIAWSVLAGDHLQKRGWKVTIVAEGVVRRARVTLRGEHSYDAGLGGAPVDSLYVHAVSPPRFHNHTEAIVPFAARGTLWCYGWTGPRVDALLSAQALT